MSSWDDEIKQVGAIQIAGGLNKSLFIKGSGDSQVITYQGAPKSLTGDVDVTAAALLNGLILADGGVGGQTLTLVTAAVVAAYINAATSHARPPSSRWGRRLTFSFTTRLPMTAPMWAFKEGLRM